MRPRWEFIRGQFFKLNLYENKFLKFGVFLLTRYRYEADFGCRHLCFSNFPLIGFIWIFPCFFRFWTDRLSLCFVYYPAYNSKYGEFMIILLRVSLAYIIGKNFFACPKLARNSLTNIGNPSP